MSDFSSIWVGRIYTTPSFVKSGTEFEHVFNWNWNFLTRITWWWDPLQVVPIVIQVVVTQLTMMMMPHHRHLW